MSRHDPALSLRQMRDHAHELVALMHGRSRGDLDTDGYDDVDYDIVWAIVSTDLPMLVSRLSD